MKKITGIIAVMVSAIAITSGSVLGMKPKSEKELAVLYEMDEHMVCEKETNSKRLFIKKLHLKADYVNNGNMTAETIIVEKKLSGNGNCYAGTIEVEDESEITSNGIFEVKKFVVKNHKTTIRLTPVATQIDTLYKNDLMIGGISCRIGTSAFGEILVTDKSNEPHITYKFKRSRTELCDILSNGITHAVSLSSLLAYIKKQEQDGSCGTCCSIL